MFGQLHGNNWSIAFWEMQFDAVDQTSLSGFIEKFCLNNTKGMEQKIFTSSYYRSILPNLTIELLFLFVSGVAVVEEKKCRVKGVRKQKRRSSSSSDSDAPLLKQIKTEESSPQSHVQVCLL